VFTRTGRLLLHPLQGTLLHPPDALSFTRRPCSRPPAGRLLLPPPAAFCILLQQIQPAAPPPAGHLVQPCRPPGPPPLTAWSTLVGWHLEPAAPDPAACDIYLPSAGLTMVSGGLIVLVFTDWS
jgi:hypothetical protein